jgi:hypothetical protein
MCLHVERWTILAFIALSLAGCAGSPELAKRPQLGDASLPCSFAGFASEDGFSCEFQDPAQNSRQETAQGSPRGSALDSSKSIHLTIHTTSADARDKCDGLSAYASPQPDSRWTLDIESSDPEDHACTLRLPNMADVPVPFWPLIEEILLLAIATSPEDADELLQLMISVLEEMRAHLAETDKA